MKLTKSLSFKVGGAFRNELSTPPLQKTINSKEDVRSHLFEEQENIGSPQLEAAISVIPLVRTTSYSALYLRWPVCLFILLDYKLIRLDLGRESKSKVGEFYLGDFDSVYIYYRTVSYWLLLNSGTFLAGLGQKSSVMCMLIYP